MIRTSFARWLKTWPLPLLLSKCSYTESDLWVEIETEISFHQKPPPYHRADIICIWQSRVVTARFANVRSVTWLFFSSRFNSCITEITLCRVVRSVSLLSLGAFKLTPFYYISLVSWDVSIKCDYDGTIMDK